MQLAKLKLCKNQGSKLVTGPTQFYYYFFLHNSFSVNELFFAIL